MQEPLTACVAMNYCDPLRPFEHAKGRGSQVLPACQNPLIVRLRADCFRMVEMLEGEEGRARRFDRGGLKRS